MNRKTSFMKALPLVLAAFFASCQKDPNPKAVAHSDAPFTLSATERRQSGTFEWAASESSPLHCDTQDLQELWITEWNSVIVTALSSDKSFDGVNYSSSDPSLVAVEKLDDFSCRLTYRNPSKEGVTISATSGAAHLVSFKVFSDEVISLQGVSVSVGDETLTIPLGTYRETIYPDDEAYVWLKKTVDYGTYPGDTVRIGHLVPENASFRYLNTMKTFVEGDTIKDGLTDRCGGAGATLRSVDWAEVEGLKAFYKPSATALGMNFNFITANADPSTWSAEKPGSGKLRTAALRARYDYAGRQNE